MSPSQSGLQSGSNKPKQEKKKKKKAKEEKEEESVPYCFGHMTTDEDSTSPPPHSLGVVHLASISPGFLPEPLSPSDTHSVVVRVE